MILLSTIHVNIPQQQTPPYNTQVEALEPLSGIVWVLAVPDLCCRQSRGSGFICTESAPRRNKVGGVNVALIYPLPAPSILDLGDPYRGTLEAYRNESPSSTRREGGQCDRPFIFRLSVAI
jgi:hypothetical protein